MKASKRFFSLNESLTNRFNVIPIYGTIALISVIILGVAGSVSGECPPFKEGEVLIQLFDEQPPASLQKDFNSKDLQPLKLLSRSMNIWLYSYRPTGMNRKDHQSFIENIRRHPKVSLAQLNQRLVLRSNSPNDILFPNQWALNNTGQTGGSPDADIDAPESWDSVTGQSTVLGDPIVIAVIDVGFDLSLSGGPVLKQRNRDIPAELNFFKNIGELQSNNNEDDDGNGYVDDYHGWNTGTDDDYIPNDAFNPHGPHGTHVAGICGALANDSEGVAGVCWNIQILPIVIPSGLDCDSVSLETFASAVIGANEYALKMRRLYNETMGAKGAFIVATNSSFGVPDVCMPADPEEFPIWCASYDSMGSVGIISVGATSNNPAFNIDTFPDMPTSCISDYLITVTSTDHSDLRKAAYGASAIDIGAPGENILSTLPGQGNYGLLSGTSLAAPHVAGAVALLLSAAQSGLINAYKNDPAAWALEVKNAILDGVDPIPSLSGITVTGGRLNLFNSVVLMRQLFCCIDNRGDVNGDGTDNTILDLNYMVNDIFRGGPSSPCPDEADLNADGSPSTILDLNFLVNDIFRGGPSAGPCP